MNIISIGIITHDAYISNLPILVGELKEQMSKLYEYKVELVVLIQSTKIKNETCVISYVNNNVIKEIYTSIISTPSEARNKIIDCSSGEWVAYIDGDCHVSEHYIMGLCKTIKEIKDEDIFLIQGAIYADKISKYGKYEAASDIRALFDMEFTQLGGCKYDKKFQDSLLNIYDNKHMMEIQKIQGYNCIVKRKGERFNEEFETAEDREIAFRTIRKGKKIIFSKYIEVYHPYNMSLNRILNRKKWHAIGCKKLRKKYRCNYNGIRIKLYKDIMLEKSISYIIYALLTEYIFWK